MGRAWMPFYIADYLGDTPHLTVTEHGAYCLMIFYYWQHGGLPDDDEMLRRITKMSTRQWRKSRATLAKFFGPGWQHKRIILELCKQAHIARQASIAGTQSAANKQAKTSTDLQRTFNARSTPVPTPVERPFNVRSTNHNHKDILSFFSEPRVATTVPREPANRFLDEDQRQRRELLFGSAKKKAVADGEQVSWPATKSDKPQ